MLSSTHWRISWRVLLICASWWALQQSIGRGSCKENHGNSRMHRIFFRWVHNTVHTRPEHIIRPHLDHVPCIYCESTRRWRAVHPRAVGQQYLQAPRWWNDILQSLASFQIVVLPQYCESSVVSVFCETDRPRFGWLHLWWVMGKS